MRKGDLLYSKFGDKVVIEVETEEGYRVIIYKTIVTNVHGKMVRSTPKKQNGFVEREALGIEYFFLWMTLETWKSKQDRRRPFFKNIQCVSDD